MSNNPSYTTHRVNMKEFMEQYRTGQGVYKDFSFQRRHVWTEKQKNDYIINIFKGLNATPIVLADITSGILASDSLGRMRYEEAQRLTTMEGLTTNTKVSMDGSNRSRIQEDFMTNKFEITGTVADIDGAEYEIKDSFFKDLPEKLQTTFKCRDVQVTTYKNLPYSKLPSVFRHLNEGCPLSDAEYRNSIQSPIAQWVRDVALKIEPLLKTVILPNKYPRMEDYEEVAAWCAYLCDGRYNINNNPSLERKMKTAPVRKNYKDRLYKIGEGHGGFYNKSKNQYPSSPYIEEQMDKVEGILVMASKIIEYANEEIINSFNESVANTKSRRSVQKPNEWSPVQFEKRIYNLLVFTCEWMYDNEKFIDKNFCLKFIENLKTYSKNLVKSSQEEYSKILNAVSSEHDARPHMKGLYFSYSKDIPQLPNRKKIKEDVTRYIETEIEKFINPAPSSTVMVA